MDKIQQKIYLSRKSLNSIEFERDVLRIPLRAGEETSFEMSIINHGEPMHVHFSLDDKIKDKVMVLQDKVYVIDEEKITAIVKLPKSYAGAVSEIGEIFVSAGYGATKRSFSVEIVAAKEKEKAKEKVKEKEEAKKKEEVKEKEKEKEKEGEGESVVEKEIRKKKRALTPEERVLFMRFAVSAVAVTFFFALLLISIYSPPDSPLYRFVFALITSSLFLFIVIYNV
jgi:hypothetical protein